MVHADQEGCAVRGTLFTRKLIRTQKFLWREIDLIGIQAYFPLSTTNAVVTRASRNAQWKRIYSELETFSKTHKRKISSTELDTLVQPWQPPSPGFKNMDQR